jgi:spermidine synthase
LLPSQVIAKTRVPDGSEIGLVRRGDEWTIRIGGSVLMSSRCHGSEEALADKTLTMVPGATRVLVGGLGIGFTLRKVLDRIAKNARVTVVELLPSIVEWNHTYLGELNGFPLNDMRCEVVVGDVYDFIRRSSSSFDAILLDVDNGPVAFTDVHNQRLYTERGVRYCYAALRPKGVYAVWSAGECTRFDGLLSHVGFRVFSERVAQIRGRRAHHVLHLGQRLELKTKTVPNARVRSERTKSRPLE